MVNELESLLDLKEKHYRGYLTNDEYIERVNEVLTNYVNDYNNTEPTEALRCLRGISCLEIVTGQTKKYNISTTINNYFNCEIGTIEHALIKAEAQGKENVELKGVVGIIKDKRVNIEYLRLSTTVREYNFKITIVIDGVKYNKSDARKLTQKEFELLKKYI